MVAQRQELDQLDTSILQVLMLEPASNDYIEEHLDELMFKYVIPEIKIIAMSMNMPQGFIDGVKFLRTGRFNVKIINTWVTRQKPLALWFNYGTKDHGPKFADYLHWIDKATGKHIYAKWVRGVPKTLAMARGIEAGMNKLKSNILTDMKDSVSQKVGI